MAEGTVKFFSERGFGFIEPDDGSAEIFLHITGLANRGDVVTAGDRVNFDTVFDTARGKVKAVDVRLIEFVEVRAGDPEESGTDEHWEL